VARVAGCSAPWTRSNTGSSSVNRSRAARVPRLTGPAGEVAAGCEGVTMLGAVGGIALVSVGDLPEEVPGRGIGAAMTEVLGHLPQAAAGQAEHGPGVRQKHRVIGPRLWQGGVDGDGSFD
jgi:hypothetical protein